MGNVLSDVRYALRGLLRAPGFTFVAVATLALGIGANTAIFSLVHAVLLKPLPYREPSRLIVAWDSYLPQNQNSPAFPRLGVSPVEFESWRQQTDVFDGTGWYRSVPLDVALTAPGGEALTVHVCPISTDLMQLLGVSPVHGRGFAGNQPPETAILSYRLWQTRFGGDPHVVGRPIRLDEGVFTVVGIMPAGFQFPDWADLWAPPGPLMGDELTNPVRHALGFVARLGPGIGEQQASARLSSLARRLAAANPKTSAGWSMQVAGLQDDLTAKVRPTLLMLLGAVALVLLIACGNVANLLLTRATGRAREIAVRSALGAPTGRIARQLLTESLVLASIGGALGLALGRIGLQALSPVPAPLDATVLLFLLGISTATGIAFGLVPAIQARRSDLVAAIKSGAVAGGGFSGLRGSLVVAEIAMALILVSGAGMLVKSFARLMHVDPGFRPQGLLTMRIAFPSSRKADVLFHRIENRVRQIPGVDGFAATSALPLTTGHGNTGRFQVPGSPLTSLDSLPAAQLRFVSPGYFKTMGIPLRFGREFLDGDLTEPVVVINQAMAQRFWPGQDPVGRKFITGPWSKNPTWSTIVGVARDVKQFGLDSEASLDIYYPALYPASIAVHTARDPRELAGAVRRAIQETDPALPVSEVRTMQQAAAESAESRRWTMTLLAAFAVLALALAVVGIYGVMSWTVAQRTREISIRVALGADGADVAGMIARYGLRLAAVGLAIGMGGAFALRRFLASLVFEVSTSDPAIYVGVAVLILATALAACYLPARRASRVDPVTALRWE